ncbi:MAG: hypothetical protein HY901_06260 [Deltaproteobacteria bacterium]|nr:hypothetical protein [Deltaproteobacteria bacterium]
MATRNLMLILASLAFAACDESGPNGSDAGMRDAQVGDTGPLAPWTYVTLDENAQGSYPISMTLRGERVAVSYWADVQTADGGVVRELRFADYDIAAGAAGTPETVAQTFNVYGSSVVLDSTGQAHVAFLGPPSNGGTKWLEACAVVASRTGSTWSQSVAATVFDQVVGLWASMVVDANDQLLVAFRDIHYGQFPVQDYQHSFLHVASGRPGGWQDVVAVNGSNRTEGHGGLNSMVLADGQPAITYSVQPGGDFDTPRHVYFIRRNPDGTWPTNPIKVRESGNTESGPKLAWKQGVGYLIAYLDVTDHGQLKLLESPDGVDWVRADIVRGSGTGGYWPVVAWRPDDLPAVAFHVCSDRSGVSLFECPAGEDELQLTWRVEDVWQKLTVDPAGGHYTQLAYLADGRAVLAYKDVTDKVLKLAIQR